MVTKDTNIPIDRIRLRAGENSRGSTVLIGPRFTTFSTDIDGNVMLASVLLVAISVVNHLGIISGY